MKCIECGRYIADGEAYFDNAAARALIPFAGRLMSDGPFCSKGCKRTYLDAKEEKAEAKALKKEAQVVSASPSYASGDLQEQRRILELQKEEREAAEKRAQQAKNAEEERQRKIRAAALREQGHYTRAWLHGNPETVSGILIAYVLGTFLIAAKLVKHRQMPAVFIGAGVLLVLAGGLVVWRIVRDARAAKATLSS